MTRNCHADLTSNLTAQRGKKNWLVTFNALKTKLVSIGLRSLTDCDGLTFPHVDTVP